MSPITINVSGQPILRCYRVFFFRDAARNRTGHICRGEDLQGFDEVLQELSRLSCALSSILEEPTHTKSDTSAESNVPEMKEESGSIILWKQRYGRIQRKLQ